MGKEYSEWRKASYSNGQGACVEVGAWRKASYSGNGEACVEVGTAHSVLIRDTTDRGGVTLSVPASAWQKFTAGLKN
jgi:hypothetical protein